MVDVVSASRTVSGAPRTRHDSFWVLALRRFLRHRLAVTGMIVMALVAALAAGARYVAPHSPTALDPVAFQAAPSETHPLGTDSVGRDALSRLIFVATGSLTVGVGAGG